MSPSLILSNSSMSKMILTLPEAVPGLAPRPLTMTFLSLIEESSPATPLSSPNVVIDKVLLVVKNVLYSCLVKYV